MKQVLSVLSWFLIPIIISIAIGSCCPANLHGKVSQEFLSTFYSVCGIIFSITVGLLLNMSFPEIRNRGFREMFRSQNRNLLNKLLTTFVITTTAFGLGKIGAIVSSWVIVVDFGILALAALVFELYYLIRALIFLHKFNVDISDCILEEAQEAERRKGDANG